MAHGSTTTKCYTTGKLKVTGSSWTYVGGLCGGASSQSELEDCYNLANIECKNTYTGQDYMADIGCGGIVGRFAGTSINKCFNKGNIIVDGETNVVHGAGICGTNIGDESSIKNCYNGGKMEAIGQGTRTKALAGIVARSYSANIAYCYNFGELVGNAENLNIGGIVAIQTKILEMRNVFNIGKIEIKERNVNALGGIIAVISEEDANVNIYNAYNIGKINAQNLDTNQIGSIAGTNWLSLIKFDNCYYLIGTYDTGVGGSGTTTGVTEVNSINKSVLDVVNEENAFKSDTNNINNGYPLLDWQ